MDKIQRIQILVRQLRKYCYEYYVLNAPSVSDAEYDRLFDELSALEADTGYILSESPTRRVGYELVSGLAKVEHPIPLLSLDKVKSVEKLHQFINGQRAMLMLKLDGLTVRLDYENGHLVLGATRGDGNEGEVITHNISAFKNVPIEIPYKGRLSISGEALIHKTDFQKINAGLDVGDEEYATPRNLAAGSVRLYDAAICSEREIYFYAFQVLEGLDDIATDPDSKTSKLDSLSALGFTTCCRKQLYPAINVFELEDEISKLKEFSNYQDIPIDGMVVSYDSIAYSQSRGRTGHHYNDGLAFKFEDGQVQTVLRQVEWNPTRSGMIAPVAVFDTVKIDGCDVSRASLHNLSFIQKMELNIGCHIKVSKRNMIIPHIEENLDRGNGILPFPNRCPCCGMPIERRSSINSRGETVETLYCTGGESCLSQKIRRFSHFVGKKALDIDGLSEGKLEKLIEKGFLTSFADLFCLGKYQDEIVAMDGFGQKSFDNLWKAIQDKKSISFDKFLVCLDIPMLGSHASRTISQYFSGDIEAFEAAITSPDAPFDFTTLDDIGQTIHDNIYEWFGNVSNTNLWFELRKAITVKKPALGSSATATAQRPSGIAGKKIVVTGTIPGYTRAEMEQLITANGGIFASSVTRNTDFLVVGDKSGGTKTRKAMDYRIPFVSAEDFLKMVV